MWYAQGSSAKELSKTVAELKELKARSARELTQAEATNKQLQNQIEHLKLKQTGLEQSSEEMRAKYEHHKQKAKDLKVKVQEVDKEKVTLEGKLAQAMESIKDLLADREKNLEKMKSSKNKTL